MSPCLKPWSMWIFKKIETCSLRVMWNRYSSVCSVRWCHLCMTLQGLMVFQYFLCINASCYAILPSLPPSPLSWYEDIFQKIMTSTKNVASGDFSTFVEELYSVSHCDILTHKMSQYTNFYSVDADGCKYSSHWWIIQTNISKLQCQGALLFHQLKVAPSIYTYFKKYSVA